MTADFPLHRTTRPVADDERAAALADPGFGKHFTDHMAAATWTPEDGWHDRRVGPVVPYSLHPSAAVLHYAQEIFEGLKAYRHADGSVWLFRPERNAARFAASARRLTLPVLPEEDFLASVEGLVRADEAWVPAAGGEQSLYLRPYMFASEAFLGVRPAHRVEYGVIASPAGAYFGSGVVGVTLWISAEFTRAAAGGTGAAKCGGNYAAGLAAQLEAREHGCDQVLYLDGAEHRWVEESGTMNVALVTSAGELVTPQLGTILDGVTRASVLDLAVEHGLTPVQRPISVVELAEGCASGSITEVFAVGTAAVITPITGFRGPDLSITVGGGAPGATTLALRAHLLDIQHGRVEDTRGWLRRVV
ncbi:branched-chain amino acid aminotransferase [Actinokineospora bangkokensis]|uniref:branched-chain-amino-acid transaminase n=1 Tax=Actinokineospora bangkokensis TaxID=1193682 RepID=A0A1Q9LKJ8_9PSEU|nr:branched-chain amino acid aminotransferase [Actinokineospora bangkokensis]OLR92548.1 branched chain amino acid aminotransferase [Actinokineospora bangkokensis]